MNDPIIEFKHFGFQYNAQAEPTLFDIDLTVRKGEKIVIIGPSGCGKSTLAHCINGLIPFALPGESTGSGLTVAEDIAFALENDCVGEPQLHDRVQKAAEMVNVSTHLLHAPSDLSGGQKQRVSLAGVMVDDVEVLLFDEPLANLDPATGKTAIELIDEIHKQTGAAIIIIEHRLEDVLHRDVDRIVLMAKGRILADAPPDEILSGPLLIENGIREPLYLSALKYARVPVTPEMRPHSIRSLELSEKDRRSVQDWFRSVPIPPEAEPQPYLLQARHVEFAYESGHKALIDVSVDIRRGEMLAIVGTNGAGKSTFSKVVCGFEHQQKGEITFAGCDWASLSLKERADHVGYVMQNPNQMISKTMIFDEVALGLRTRKVPEEEIRPRVENVLKVCGLWPFRNWPISALSFGQKKRVTIASILVLDPEMIILDEPTAGQDYRHYTEIMEFLRDLNARGVTVVLITHDMHLMLEYAPRAVVFSAGQVLADDSSAAVLTDPEIIAKASLKETSLYDLALMCGVDDPRAFVQRFIDHEREEARQS